MNKCLFATVLTYPAPSANYRGESEENRSVIQKITDGRFEYAVMSPESMREALRKMLRGYGLPSNRERLHNEEQLAVRFIEVHDPTKYVDDWAFGYLLALKEAQRKEVIEKTHNPAYRFKRDSLLRMNLARALAPYRYNTLFTQSPQNKTEGWPREQGKKNDVVLLHRETSTSAFQYPFAFNLVDVFGEHTKTDEDGAEQKKWNVPGPDMEVRRKWFSEMLRAIAELTDVAGNHARSLFHMAPASVVIRLTDRMVPGFNSYGFQVDDKGNVSLPEVIDGIKNGDYPGEQFYLGGVIVKQLSGADRAALGAKAVHLFRMGDQALAAASKDITGIDFLDRK
jgi:CRISPR-associated protein Cst2